MLHSSAILGGGAAGIMAAISATRNGKRVVICEKMPALGKKILVSGNGRCNLLNDRLNESYYNPSSRRLVKAIFQKFGKDGILNFFRSLGLELYQEDGRYFPATNQSASVLKVLELELKQLSVPVELNFDVSDIVYSDGHFTITSKTGKKVESDSLIFACGGRTYPALGSDGSAHRLATRFGHKIIEPVPAAVPLVVKDPICHILQGQRIRARAKSIIDGKAADEASGDLLFTKYGLSGTVILDISEGISIAINRSPKKDVVVSVDLVPFVSEDRLRDELKRRISGGYRPEDLFAGILPNKFGASMQGTPKARDAGEIAHGLKYRSFKIAGTRGWNEADFTAGGVDIKDVREDDLASKLQKGLYFAGEVLDVSGRRGGYNLAWAWASGFVAGSAV